MDPDGTIANFLRRWSTVDITLDNGLLFDEHLFSISILIDEEDKHLIEGISRETKREEFAARHRKLLNGQ